MDTVLIQIQNPGAYRLLEELEALHILKVLKVHTDSTQKLSEKYAGKLPSEVADKLQDYVSESRGEWDNKAI